jgi:hypothetical protein
MSGDESSRAERDSLTEIKARAGTRRAGSYDVFARYLYLKSVHDATTHREERSADRRHDDES